MRVNTYIIYRTIVFIKNGRENQLCDPVPTCVLKKRKVVLLMAIKG